MTDIVLEGAGSAEAAAGTVTFDGRRKVLLGLLVKNYLLGILTLGIYRFWAKTAVRRYFWGHVSIAGERVEYTGRGKELFLGFLIVMAILIPVAGVYGFLAETMIGSEVGSIVVNVVYYAALFFLIQIAIFRMRRYRLTRTVWRGIRAGQDGSPSAYMLLAWRWSLAVLLTLGYLYPRMRIALARYLTANMRYGSARFAFKPDPAALMRRWLPVWIARVIGIGGAGASIYAFYARAPVAPWLTILTAIVLAGAFYLYIHYRAYELRCFVGWTRLGETTFSSGFTARVLLRIVLVYALLAGLWTFVMAAVIGSAFGPLFTEGEELLGSLAGMEAFGVIILVIVLLGGYTVIKFLWLRYELVRRIAATLAIRDLAAIEAVIQDSQEIPRFGEGLADGLDVGDF